MCFRCRGNEFLILAIVPQTGSRYAGEFGKLVIVFIFPLYPIYPASVKTILDNQTGKEGESDVAGPGCRHFYA
jgi:hypothetical protein